MICARRGVWVCDVMLYFCVANMHLEFPPAPHAPLRPHLVDGRVSHAELIEFRQREKRDSTFLSR